MTLPACHTRTIHVRITLGLSPKYTFDPLPSVSVQIRGTTLRHHLKRRFAKTSSAIRERMLLCSHFSGAYHVDEDVSNARTSNWSMRSENYPQRQETQEHPESMKGDDQACAKQKDNPIFNTEEHLLYMFRKANIKLPGDRFSPTDSPTRSKSGSDRAKKNSFPSSKSKRFKRTVSLPQFQMQRQNTRVHTESGTRDMPQRYTKNNDLSGTLPTFSELY